METRASHLLVGSFVLIFIAGMMAFAVWMAKVSPDQNSKDYDIFFEGSVSGLINRGTVFYLGIPVGEVRSIELADDPRKVKVTVRLGSNVPVNQQSRARLEFQGLTGVAYIEIMGGNPEAAPLQSDRGKNPVITAEASNFQAIFEKAPNLVDEAIKTIGSVQMILNEENRNNVAGILANGNKVMGNLARGTENLDVLMARATTMMNDVSVTLAKVNKLADSGNALLENDAVELMTQAKTAMGTINTLAGRMDQMVQANEGAVTTFVNGTLPEVSRMIMDLRSAARALSRLSAKIEANPAQVIFPPEPKKFDAKTGKPVKEEK